MFSKLLASRPVRERSTGGLGASMALHGLIFAGALSATVTATSTVNPTRVVDVVYQPATPPPERAAPPRAPTVAPVPGTPGVVSVPVDVPSLLPIVDPVRSLGEAPSFTHVGSTPPGMPETPRIPDGVPYRAEEVEIVVAIAKGSPLPRFPSTMRFAGVAGSARFQFVVDTLGSVELATVREIESTHEAFAFAVRSTLSGMRFTPARVGGRAVRQLVEFPTIFRLER